MTVPNVCLPVTVSHESLPKTEITRFVDKKSIKDISIVTVQHEKLARHRAFVNAKVKL